MAVLNQQRDAACARERLLKMAVKVTTAGAKASASASESNGACGSGREAAERVKRTEEVQVAVGPVAQEDLVALAVAAAPAHTRLSSHGGCMSLTTPTWGPTKEPERKCDRGSALVVRHVVLSSQGAPAPKTVHAHAQWRSPALGLPQGG